MLCEKCNMNIATVHLETVINGNITEKHLCGYCAAQANLNNNSFTDMLASLLDSDFANGIKQNKTRCPKCNLTFAQIAEDGVVGCENCYTTFAKELLPYIKRLHGSTIHIGNMPNKTVPAVLRPQDEIHALRMKLNSLIKSEQFEQAAVVRDAIKQLEKENA